MNGPVGSLEPQGWLVETSALVAIILREPEAKDFATHVATNVCKTCVFNLFEASLAVAGRRIFTPSKANGLNVALIEEFAVEIVPLTPEMIPHAVAARERYGRGRKGLNMGDCLSYAAAKQLDLKLIYKGDDFSATDVNG